MAAGQFPRRILLVDSDTDFLQVCSNALRRQGYEVLTAEDGFGALHILRGAQPDVLVTELNLPRMSGFELLSVIRSRFPAISVVALSGEYTVATLPNEAICDAFFPKDPNIRFELVEQVRRLVSDSPVRSSRAKGDFAPVWIPRSTVGYLVLTCPECLRSFSAAQPKSTPANETCLFCGANVQFQMSSFEGAPIPPPESAGLRSRIVREHARDVVARSRQIRKHPDGFDMNLHEFTARAVVTIKTEIETGHTFSRVGLESNDRNTMARNLASARKAYDIARAWAEKTQAPPVATKEIADQLELLRADLTKLEQRLKYRR